MWKTLDFLNLVFSEWGRSFILVAEWMKFLQLLCLNHYEGIFHFVHRAFDFSRKNWKNIQRTIFGVALYVFSIVYYIILRYFHPFPDIASPQITHFRIRRDESNSCIKENIWRKLLNGRNSRLKTLFLRDGLYVLILSKPDIKFAPSSRNRCFVEKWITFSYTSEEV